MATNPLKQLVKDMDKTIKHTSELATEFKNTVLKQTFKIIGLLITKKLLIWSYCV